jgi:hypothetical protein
MSSNIKKLRNKFINTEFYLWSSTYLVDIFFHYSVTLFLQKMFPICFDITFSSLKVNMQTANPVARFIVPDRGIYLIPA